MTDASGVPTSPDNIPTYNTSVDAPSGLGFNTAMAQLQAIFTNLKAGTLASGKILPAGISWTGAYPFTNADIAAAAALAVSKLAPGTNGQFMQTTGGVAVWGAGPTTTTYRRTTATVVNNTIAETDLLGGAITIAAGSVGSTGVVRITADGDSLQNTGAAVNTMCRFKLKLGATTLIDTGAPTGNPSNGWVTGATRYGWRFTAEIKNLGATNSQAVKFHLDFFMPNGGNAITTVSPTTGIGWNSAIVGPSSNLQGWYSDAINTAAVDTTVAQALVLSVINPTASVNMETKLFDALVEII